MSGSSIQRLIAFCDKQPKRSRYVYDDMENCALAQWYRSEGRKYSMARSPFEEFAANEPHTFGSLVRRLRKYAETMSLAKS